MHKDGEIKRLQGKIVALQKSQLQLKQEIRKPSQNNARQMAENRFNQHLKKDNRRLRMLNEQLSKDATQHKQEVVQLQESTARLRKENAHLRGACCCLFLCSVKMNLF